MVEDNLSIHLISLLLIHLIFNSVINLSPSPVVIYSSTLLLLLELIHLKYHYPIILLPFTTVNYLSTLLFVKKGELVALAELEPVAVQKVDDLLNVFDKLLGKRHPVPPFIGFGNRALQRKIGEQNLIAFGREGVENRELRLVAHGNVKRGEIIRIEGKFPRAVILFGIGLAGQKIDVEAERNKKTEDYERSKLQGSLFHQRFDRFHA